MGISRRKPLSLRAKLKKLSSANYNSRQGGEAGLDAGDWGIQLRHGLRQRIVNKIMETLKRHLPFSGQEGINELKKIAGRFEEKIYTAATSQSDYLRKVSLKMLSMESKSHNAMLPSNNAGNSNKPPDPEDGYLSNMHPQHLGPRSNVSGLQQQQRLLGTEFGNSSYD